jgi:hypothetical protein
VGQGRQGGMTKNFVIFAIFVIESNVFGDGDGDGDGNGNGREL